ncbi:MAG: patatin-like phospholipase family protein [Patescibacteria group bacterium]
MARDIIIMIEGGAMLGVFGAGVVTAFQEADIYPRIHSVYGASAGAHDLAYFLAAQADSRQARVGSSIYYEDLIGRRFINPSRFFVYIWDLIVRRFRPRHAVRHILDLDYIIHVEQTVKKLDVRALVGQLIPFYIAAYDVARGQVVFLDGKQDTFQTLKASSTASPFYANTVEVRGRQYLDGGLIQDWDVEKIVREHPEKKIVYVINNKKNPWFTGFVLPYYLLEAVLNLMCFGWKISWSRLKNSFAYETKKKLFKFPNVTVVSNVLEFTNSITDKAVLLSIYEHGLVKGREALVRLGLA